MAEFPSSEGQEYRSPFRSEAIHYYQRKTRTQGHGDPEADLNFLDGVLIFRWIKFIVVALILSGILLATFLIPVRNRVGFNLLENTGQGILVTPKGEYAESEAVQGSLETMTETVLVKLNLQEEIIEFEKDSRKPVYEITPVSGRASDLNVLHGETVEVRLITDRRPLLRLLLIGDSMEFEGS